MGVVSGSNNNKKTKSGTAAKKTTTTKRTTGKSNSSAPTGTVVDRVVLPPADFAQLHGDFPGSPVRWNDPPPLYTPNVVPGLPGKAGDTLYRGTIRPVPLPGTRTIAQQANKFGFRFHYNPETFKFNYVSSADAVNRPQDGQIQDLSAVYHTFGFDFVISRIEDVMAQRRTAHSVLGTQEFTQLGSMYDVEWLFRVINGDTIDNAEAGVLDSATVAILKAAYLDIKFSRALRFRGRAATISLDHLLLSPTMVPILTKVSISMTGLVINDASNSFPIPSA